MPYNEKEILEKMGDRTYAQNECFTRAVESIDMLSNGKSQRVEDRKCFNLDEALKTLKEYYDLGSLSIVSTYSGEDPNGVQGWHSFVVYDSSPVSAYTFYPGKKVEFHNADFMKKVIGDSLDGLKFKDQIEIIRYEIG